MERQNLDIEVEESTINKFFVLNIIVLISVVIITGFHCVVTIFNYHYLFSWHVVTGSLAYLFLAPVSIIIVNEMFLKHHTSKQRNKIHGIIIFTATLLAAISVILESIRKEIYKPQYPTITHFESPHAITGLISVILYVLSNFSGLLAHNLKWLQGKIRPVILQLSHNLLGQIAYVLGMISIFAIFFTSWYEYHHTICGIGVMTILLLFVTISSLVKPIKRAFSLIKNLS